MGSPSLPSPSPPQSALSHHPKLSMQFLQTLKLPRYPSITTLCLCPSQLTQTCFSLQMAPKQKTQGTQQKSLSCLLYLPKRRVNKHRDLCHSHCQGLDDGHSLCPSKCHVCMRTSAPPGATKGKGTCRCCVSCSHRNPTFLGHLAQSPGVGLHPAILLLQEEEKNQSESNTQPARSCTALHKPHTRSLGEAMPLEPTRRSKASSHQQQQFFRLSYQPQGQIPKLLYSSSSLGLNSCQRFLCAPELAARGQRDFVCSLHIK